MTNSEAVDLLFNYCRSFRKCSECPLYPLTRQYDCCDTWAIENKENLKKKVEES